MYIKRGKMEKHIKKTGIIFDLDGTLLNTLDDLVDSVNYVLKKHQFPIRTNDEIRKFVGNGIKMLMIRSLPKSVDNFDVYYNEFFEYYSKNMQNQTKPYPGIIELLSHLKQKEVLMAIVSNKFQQGVDELCEEFFSDYIKVAVGTTDILKPKPAPDSVFYAIKKLDLLENFDQIYYVGDTEVDIETAENAQIPIIAVTWGFRDRCDLEKAPYIIDKPLEILNILDR